MSTPKGFPAQSKLDRLRGEHVTVEPARDQQQGMSVVAHQYVRLVGSDAVEAGSTASNIVATAHAALKGDVIRFTSGAMSGREVKVSSVDANDIVPAEDLPSAPSVGVTFDILRHKYPLVNPDGSLSASIASAPIEYLLDGVPTVVTEDTGTPANNRPLPVKILSPLPTGGNTIGTVNVASSALPSGAATEATLSSLNGKVTAVNTGAVVVASSALPSGAATEATLSSLNGKVTAVDTGAVVVASSALPTGAATESTLSSLNGKVTAVNTGAVVVASSALPTGAATEATLSTLNSKVTAVNTGAVVVASSALPSGAATEATLASLNGKVVAVDTGAVTISAPLPAGTNSIGSVVISGQDVVDLFDTPLLDSSSTNIPGSASNPLAVVASLAADVKSLDIMDTTGGWIGLYTGAALSEVLKLIIGPGQDRSVQCVIPSGTRISVKNMQANTISVGEMAINFLG